MISGWIFCYNLSRKIEVIGQIKNSNNIEFILKNETKSKKKTQYLTGFKITYMISSEKEAEKNCDRISDNLRNLIIIKSGMPVKIYPNGHCVIQSSQSHNPVVTDFVQQYDIEGAIKDLDPNDKKINKIFDYTMQKRSKYQYFSRGIVNYYSGYPVDCIRELFKVIETMRKFPKWKFYKVIRDVFSHNPYAHYPNTITIFNSHFRNKLDYEIITKPPKKVRKQILRKKILIDQTSSKNHKVLDKIALDFIKELRKRYNLN